MGHSSSKMKTGSAKAAVDGTLVAETTQWHEVEGNVYFPAESIKREFFTPTDLHTTCGWKGEASYYTVTVGDTKLENAAWYYPTPKDAAQEIKDCVAFYKNKVTITKESA